MSVDFPQCDPRRFGTLGVLRCPHGCMTVCASQAAQQDDPRWYSYRVVNADGTSASYTWETLEDAQECRDRRAAMYPDDGPQKIQRRLIWEWEDAPDAVASTRIQQPEDASR